MSYFDLHCDTISDCCKTGKPLWENDFQLSLARGKKYVPWIQCFAVWIPDEKRGKAALDYFDTVFRCFQAELKKNKDLVRFCRTADDLKRVREQKEIGAVLTVEGGAAAAGEINRLQYLAECGVRVMTLTWNSSSEFGDGAGVEKPHGLTEFGKRAVAEMERLNIVVDVSHASDPLFYDVARNTKKPFIATHSNSRSVCGGGRNLTDEQFGIIRARGGLVGINFVPDFLNSSGTADVDDVFRHIDHFLSLGGEKAVCIGSDFDGTRLPDGFTGVESAELVAERMLRANYSESLVRSVFFENAYQFFLSL